MEGYLYVNEDEFGLASEGFTRRFFILFPFCGLRWYLKEPPADLSYNRLLQHDLDDDSRLESGWVYGGNVRVDSVTLEKEFSLVHSTGGSSNHASGDEDGSIFPFVVKLRCGEDFIQVRLATDDEAQRLAWVRDLRGAESMQAYLSACADKSSIPSRKVFASIRNVTDRKGIHFENMRLSQNVLESVIKYIHISAPHGTMLHSLRLENVELGQVSDSLICSLLNTMSHLTELSFAENNLADSTVIAVSAVLKQMTTLQEVDFSCNLFGDAGIDALSQALQPSKSLERLDLSRNKLTSKSVRPMALYLCGHSSKLKVLNLSYNKLGNGVAALASILMTNKPPSIADIDISYTGLSEVGIKELTKSISQCESIQHIKVKGNTVSDHAVLTKFVEAVSQHQREFCARGSQRGVRTDAVGLSLHIGGMHMEDVSPRCLSYKVNRKALPYVEDQTLLRSVILRQRILKAPNIVDDANLLVVDPVDVTTLCFFRLQLPLHIYSTQEFVESLAEGLGAHIQQLRIVSSSNIEAATRSCDLTVALEESTPRIKVAQTARAVIPIYTSRLPVDKTSNKFQRSSVDLPTVSQLLDVIHHHSRNSSPLFRKLGIREISTQSPPSPENPLAANTASFRILLSGSGGRVEHMDEHIPIVAPHDADYYSIDNIVEPDSSDDEGAAMEEHYKDNFDFVYFQVHPDRGVGTITDRLVLSEEIIRLEQEAAALLYQERKERHVVSEQLVMAVRELRRNEEITTQVAQFWEGAFGNAKCRAQTTDALRAALNEYGIFHAVGRWNLLCEAMALRDTPVMAAQIMHIKQDAMDGGTALLLGQRLLSEILSLQRDAVSLEALATQPEHIPFVENFLLTCGKLGYSGPEMTAATDLRKKLIYWAAEEKPELIQDATDLIKQRALLSNLMISRDFNGLVRALEGAKASAKGKKNKSGARQGIEDLAETAAAKNLLRDFKLCMGALVDAVKSQRIPKLEKALAEAAFLGLGVENKEVNRATRMLANLASMPGKLLKPIVAGIRDRNLSRVENAIEAAYSMGWRIPPLDISVAPKILSKLSEIAAIDEARTKLKQLALSVRNGFPVKAGEVLQLLRRAEAFKLQEDHTNKQYFEQLNKYVKKYSSVLNQEKKIQDMIDDEEIELLQEVLSGKGKAKLFISCPSEELRNDWMEMLQAAVAGTVGNRPVDENDLLMAGTMDKAARSEKPPHDIRGWRTRYFVLQGKTLTYFVARNGAQKGLMRVYGGDCRIMTPDEADGRKFAIEIQEGRDLSLIATDLLVEAKKTVDKHRVKEVQSMLEIGIRLENLPELEAAIQLVDDGVQADFNLVRKARSWIKRLRERNLKIQLHQAALTVPRAHMEELIRHAHSSLIDPTNTLLSRLVRIAEQPDLTQLIVRARGAVEMSDDNIFRRSINSLSKFEPKRFSNRDGRMLTAAIFQHAGNRILRSEMSGESSSLEVKLLRQALASVRHLYIETEAMQIAKMLISMTDSNSDVGKTKSGGVLAYLDDAALNEAMTSRFTIEKYDQLRAPTGDDKGVLEKLSSSGGAFLSKIIGSRKGSKGTDVLVANQHMSYSESTISKPMLRSGPKDSNFNNLSKCSFSALQAVMGDKKPKSILSSKDNYIGPKNDIADAIAALVEVGRSEKLNPRRKEHENSQHKDTPQNMADELYVQLCKQLSGHPVLVRRLRGWLLFSIYLHSFPPTKHLAPYLKNFIARSAAIEQAMIPESLAKVKAAFDRMKNDAENGSVAGGEVDTTNKQDLKDAHKHARHDELEGRTAISKVALYCIKLLNRLDKHEIIEDSEKSLDSRGSQKQAKIVQNVCAAVVGRAPLTFELVLLTGSEFRFTIKYGDIDTPYSLLPLLYGRLIGSEGELRHIMDKHNLKGRHRSPLAWQDWLMKQFRGFAFYEVEANKHVGTLLDIPVQAEESALCSWDSDVIWDLIFKRVAVASGQDTESEFEIPDDIDTLVGKKLVLRRRIASSTEPLAGSLELFQDQVSDNDLVTMRSMWVDWLTADKPLPADHIRVDLLFAEESRYVNSRLYHAPDDCFYFLLGMQLALTWESKADGSDEAPEHWGEGADAVLGSTDLSVRPAYRIPYHFAKSSHGRSSQGSKDGKRTSKRASRVTRFSTYFRGSTTGAGGEGARIGESIRKRLTLGGASSYALFGDTFQSTRHSETASQASGSERGDLESKRSDDDDASDFYSTTDDDVSYDTDDKDPSSSDTSSDEEEKERKRSLTVTRDRATATRKGGRKPLISYSDLYMTERVDLQTKLVALGIDPQKCDLERAVNWMVKFQHLTDQPNQVVETSSPQFRYLMKRAYLHYLQCWPLYGFHFSEAVLLIDPEDSEDSQLTDTPAHAGPDYRRNVLVGISPNGIMLLDPDEWSKVMHSSLSDIESAVLSGGEETGINARDSHASFTPRGSCRSSNSDDSSIPDDTSSMRNTPESRVSTPESSPSQGSSGRGTRSGKKGSSVTPMSKLPTIRDEDEDDSEPSEESDPPADSDSDNEIGSPDEDSMSEPESDDEDDLSSPPPSGSDDEPPSESGSSRSSRSRASRRGNKSSRSSRSSKSADSESGSERSYSESRSYIRDKSSVNSRSGTGTPSLQSGHSGRSSRLSEKSITRDRAKLLRHQHLVIHFRGVDSEGGAKEMTIRLVGKTAKEQQSLLHACCLEVLGRGMFPHGSEGGNDFLPPGEPQVAANDTKEILRKFLRDFPILPIPPTPVPLALAPDFFEIPKSRHVLASEDREREEENERDNARKAASASEALRRQERDEGRRILRDEVGDGNEQPEDTGGLATEQSDDLGDNPTNTFIVQATSGVPSKRSTRAVPPAPVRIAGKLRLNMPASRVTEAPELQTLSVLHPNSLPPVGTAWGGAIDKFGAPARPGAPTSPSRIVKHTGAAVLPQPGWSEHVASYIDRSNLLLEEIVESERLIHESTNIEYVFVGQLAKRRKKKDKGLVLG